jgi:hypothetical protein
MGNGSGQAPGPTWVRLCVSLFLALIAAQFVALTVPLFLKPDLRSSSCDFPEECLSNFHSAAFAPAQWLWWGGVGVAVLSMLGLAASHAPRARLVLIGGTVVLFGESAFLSPVLRGPAAISYDGQGGVTVFSVPYLLAMLLLGLAGVILWWDLMTRSRSVRRTPGAHVRV